jgi:hypothetical protein
VIKLRKGTVFIFTGEYPSDYFLDYIANKLPRDINKKVIKASRYIKVNGYDIRIIQRPDYHTRGYRPEFIYCIGNTLDDRNIEGSHRAMKQIRFDTEYKSTRKEPIRYINEAEEIDLREFIDDDYSLLQCRFKKLEWKDKFRYVWLKIRNKFRKEIQ